MTAEDQPEPAPGLVEWLGVGVLTLTGMLAALLEALLVPLYAGSVLVPVTVLFAIATNIALPRLARNLVPRAGAVLLPFAGWLFVIVVFGVVARPEGDVILPGGGGLLQYASYGVMLGGALAGTITVVISAPPRSPAPRQPVKG